MVKYKIVRFFRDNRPSEIINVGLTLEQAKEHCSREDTHGEGWFDGYTEEKVSKKNKPIEFTIKTERVCHRCGYSWTPRKENPKECPRCKARMDGEIIKIKVDDTEPEAAYVVVNTEDVKV